MATLPTSPPTEDVSEAELARTAGVSRDDLKKLRARLEASMWHGGHGSAVMITPAGVARLQELLETDRLGADTGTEKKGAVTPLLLAAQAVERGELYDVLEVIRVTGRMLLAKKPGEKTEYRVAVKATKNFRAGMKLERCQASTETPGVYYYHGRTPRAWGRY